MAKLTNSNGFSLLEMIFYLFLASILSLMLFNFLNQITKLSKVVGELTDYTDQMTSAYDQLDRDFSAIFVPPSYAEKMTEKNIKDTSAQAPQTGAPFACLVTEGQRAIISMITTTHLPRYRAWAPAPTLVVYRIVPECKGRFLQLIRYETSNLLTPLADFEKDAVPGFTLIEHIQDLKIKLFAPDVEKKKAETSQPQSAKETQQSKQKQRLFNSWDPEAVTRETGLFIPAFIELEGIWIDPSRNHARSFRFFFKILSFDGSLIQGRAPTPPKVPDKKGAPQEKKGTKPPPIGQKPQPPGIPTTGQQNQQKVPKP